MIINIRGTSGSGKSTLVRRITELYQRKIAFKEAGRRQPIGYAFMRPNGKTLAVIGHYETPCGGCDTITNQDYIYSKVRAAHHAGMDVLYEGLLISAETRRCIELYNEVTSQMTVIALGTPLEVCLASINERRRAKDADKPDVNPKNTENKFKGVQSAMRKLQASGVHAIWADREGAFNFIKGALSV